MKRLILFLFIAVLFLTVITGCGPSPEQVVANFFVRLKADDVTGAKKYTSEAFGNNLSSTKAFLDLIGVDPFANGADLYTKENLRSEIKDDTARVWQKDKSYLVFVLKKRDGKWLIESFDTNIKLPDLGNLIH